MRRCRPTLHRWARSRRGGGAERRGRFTLHRRIFSRREKRLAGGGGHLRCTEGPPPAGGFEEGGGGDGERGYLSTLHRRVPSSHQESRERRLSPWRKLRKTGSCSSLNSPKEPILLNRLLRWLGKFPEEGREFVGAGREIGDFPPIVLAGVAPVGRNASALCRGPIMGPSARKTDDRVGCAWA
jgi:hypothetical protein